MQGQEPRGTVRRTFIEGQGHLVEEVPHGSPLAPGAKTVAMHPEPARPVTVVSVENVPLLVALQVVQTNGMVAVPRTFLTEEQLAELDKNGTGDQYSDGFKGPGTGEGEPGKTDYENVALVKVDQAIARVKLAANFEELNGLTRDEKRVMVLRAAEERANELKTGGDAQ